VENRANAKEMACGGWHKLESGTVLTEKQQAELP